MTFRGNPLDQYEDDDDMDDEEWVTPDDLVLIFILHSEIFRQ